ncbi:nuclease-related domain-containing protein [Fervidibacillus halotolerans]|uniref:NERD domain-containing protein n=1 Tax=Fervidibacillus halotolerans TaxID=2980027 RepID=A0A9E8LYG5_9BACI|nr:nuclease-related domain-containing protein [Fervidibacillus halotolerans]WAA12088.1 NERD domain-containing protein [Fervidibacillus halotolerans]
MIIKPYAIPFDVLQIEALERRIPRSHPKKGQIQQELKKHMFGQQGEKEVFYQLQFLPEKHFYLFHNLRLIENERVFQIDILVLHPNFITIIEVKHFKGNISFNDIGQLVHESGEVYDHPINQVEKHKLQFQNWLTYNNFPIPPIETFVVLGPATKFLPNNTYTKHIQKLVPTSTILPTILELAQRYKKPIFRKNQIDQLCTTVQSAHTPLQKNVLTNFQIQSEDLIQGVLCPICATTVMDRIHGKWFCSACEIKEEKCHIHAFNDYYCLIKETITIKEAKQFLNIHRYDLVKYLIKKEQYKKIGKTKGTKYVLTFKKV